ncbi:MAG: hypothetical protein KDJ48_08820 [Nitratireductor sp.]|nr:hypothetical protein [Nitratireductor sp.]MCB1459348.1 hypothetical protein [Nitratireductor sp.]
MVQLAAQGTSTENSNAGRPAWAGAHMRLDPYNLPHRLDFNDGNATSYSIDRQGAVMKRRLNCGLPVSMALPVKSFKGVAARAIENEDGSLTVSLELHHHDSDLCVPLLVSDNLDDIAADWHAWSRLLQLPMLIIGSDAIARPVREQLGQIMVEPAIARRKRNSSFDMRPWFLRRRKPGMVGEVVRITGEELIARR